MRTSLALVVGLGVFGCANGAPQGQGPLPDAAAHAPEVDAEIDAPRSPLEACFPGLADPTKPHPDYEQFHPVINADCAGTNYQDITGVEKVVFLGDSITTGTPPTFPTDFYRTLVGEMALQRFGLFTQISDCSGWGARTDDLMNPPHDQVHSCLPDVEPKKTLIVMTMGGNDMNSIAGDAATDTPAQTMAKVDQAVAYLEQAVTWLKDPAHFPNGSYVVFANIYEFTDATGDLLSCPGAALAGFSGTAAPQMTAAYLHATEEYMRIAVQHHADMVFSLESFCGHGFHASDPHSACYRGPGAETWFDLTCIHPNPTGHHALATLFDQTIAD